MNTDEPGSEPTATDSEIERAHAKWASARRAEHLKFVKQFSFHTSSAFMDYLHGDVKEEEASFACRYEYAREFPAMWEAANERDALHQANRQAACKQNALAVFRRHPGQWWASDTWLLRFMRCESFPRKDWNELTEAERNKIMEIVESSQRRKIWPLPTWDVGILEALGVFDKFRAMANDAERVVEDVPPCKKPKPTRDTPPVLQQHGSWYHVIFTLDYSNGGTHLGKEFNEWLKLPQNQTLLKKHQKLKTGKTGQPVDRLKDLAAWRLYRELGNDWNKANDFAREHRKRFTSAEIRQRYKTTAERAKFKHGRPKPFHDAKRQDRKPCCEADLFGEDADARKATAAARGFLAELTPDGFAPPEGAMLAALSATQPGAKKLAVPSIKRL